MTERTVLQPIAIGGTTRLRNRLYRAPVLEGAGDGDDAPANYAKQFVANAEAGVGLVIQGSACIYEEGRSSPGMTIVSTRERVLRFTPMVEAVQAAGAAIWLQVGHGGLFSMESWHEPYVSQRTGPLLVASKPPLALRPIFRKAPLHVMTTDEVRAMTVRYGEIAAWAREAGYDGFQLGSSNAKLLDQFLSPFWNRRDDEFGGSPERRASVLRLIRERVAERAGEDFTITLKIPVDEKAPPFTARTTWDEGIQMAKLAEEFGYDSVTPVGVSVFPDATLSRGGVPRSLWKNKAMQTRFRAASPRRIDRGVLMAGYVWGGISAPYRPVWNRSRFIATKAAVSIPVLAVGGIRDAHEVDEILDGGQADLVGIGRPFYAEPDLPRRILGGSAEEGLCQYSNLCVPAQMLGMKGACYNPAVVKLGRSRSGAEADDRVSDAAGNGVLLVSCPDRAGIVAAVAAFVAEHGGNVVDLQQHTDHTDGAFFQRVELELDGVDLARDEIGAAFGPVADRFGMRWNLRFTDERPRVALLASKEPHCLHDLLNRWRTGELAVEIPVIVSNHPDHAAIADWYDVPYALLPIVDGDKAAQEVAVADVLREHRVDLVVLARYMQVLSPAFSAAWPEGIINIHHSFLPAFQGARPYHQAHERGVKVIGVTAHYATAELDDGPIIDQDVLRVSHRDDVDDLRRKGRDLEVSVLARAVRAHVGHRVLVYGKRTVVFD